MIQKQQNYKGCISDLKVEFKDYDGELNILSTKNDNAVYEINRDS